MRKSEVNGDDTNEVYQWLKSKKSGLLGMTRIKVCCFEDLWGSRFADGCHDVVSGTLRSSWSIRMAMLSTVGPRRPHLRRLEVKSRSCCQIPSSEVLI